MRRHFRCGGCHRAGCCFSRPREEVRGANGRTYWDPEFFPVGRELHMAGGRLSGESYEMAGARVSAAYLARYPCGDAIRTVDSMCNLYSITSTQQAIRDLVKAMRDMTGNLPPLPAVFPDKMAPVVRTAPDGVRELVMMRWGFPQKDPQPGEKKRTGYVTNVRHPT